MPEMTSSEVASCSEQVIGGRLSSTQLCNAEDRVETLPAVTLCSCRAPGSAGGERGKAGDWSTLTAVSVVRRGVESVETYFPKSLPDSGHSESGEGAL
ncbi:hypothetical protein BaRGS_00026630 [Batillaria attramentaria]|uniref:Uncharacterized protein n=1 Tax=Batillaria attramentaria TaxID=370345 RepID=A0ABD0K440_9CAEN